jgi:hypothetical protein
MIEQVFTPAWNAVPIANSATATAQVALPSSCFEVALYNSSATALTVVRVTSYEGAVPPVDGTENAPTMSLGFPVPPGQLIRLRVGAGNKIIRTIASAADGNIWVIPGNGG